MAGPYLDYEIIAEPEQTRGRHALERHRLGIFIGDVPVRNTRGDFLHSREYGFRVGSSLSRRKARISLFGRHHIFRRVIFHVAPVIGRQVLRMRELGRILVVRGDVIDRRVLEAR